MVKHFLCSKNTKINRPITVWLKNLRNGGHGTRCTATKRLVPLVHRQVPLKLNGHSRSNPIALSIRHLILLSNITEDKNTRQVSWNGASLLFLLDPTVTAMSRPYLRNSFIQASKQTVVLEGVCGRSPERSVNRRWSSVNLVHPTQSESLFLLALVQTRSHRCFR